MGGILGLQIPNPNKQSNQLVEYCWKTVTFEVSESMFEVSGHKEWLV
jgi:hypothetical protein